MGVLINERHFFSLMTVAKPLFCFNIFQRFRHYTRIYKKIAYSLGTGSLPISMFQAVLYTVVKKLKVA